MNELIDFVEYDDELHLVWKKSKSKKIKVGSKCGCASKVTGYWQMMFNKKNYRVHIVVWYIHNGEIPNGMEIDHIDHDRSNNSISNLRLVTRKENGRNQSVRIDNSTGVTGVSWHKPLSKYCARITVDGKLMHLGYFNSIEEAKLCRIQFQRKFKFHKNHGE